uniref:Dynein heavy chain AAA module D4 domain-containing protein n=1 Tax=Panagrolaimus sp. ES5 TaxID=591445 RepID=A0AC34GUJ2_9BILA
MLSTHASIAATTVDSGAQIFDPTTSSRHPFIVICTIAEAAGERGDYGFSVIGSNETLDSTAFVIFTFFGIIFFFFLVMTTFRICRCYFKKRAFGRPYVYHIVPHGDASRSTTRNYRRKKDGKSRTTASSLIFDQMTERILRIDRIYPLPQGHQHMTGISGSGKTTFLRFVAWINGIPVFQLKVHSGYTGAHLLANGKVPGLFVGEENTSVMNQISAAQSGQMLVSNEKLNQWFKDQIIQNLHVVFTMNPSSDGLHDRASPALFNRWADSALYQGGQGDILTDEEKDAIRNFDDLNHALKAAIEEGRFWA